MKRAWFELSLAIVVGVGHLVFDGLLGLKGYYIGASVAALAVYASVRLRRPGQAAMWGMGLQNLKPAAIAATVLLIAGTSTMVAYGLAHGRTRPPASFFWLALLYPVWGLVQQFVLCPLLYRNLVALRLGPLFSTAVSAILFGLVHAPDWTLCGLTTVSAVIWIRLYERWPNLWCQGVSQGVLGALAYYYVLGRDPWTELLANLSF